MHSKKQLDIRKVEKILVFWAVLLKKKKYNCKLKSYKKYDCGDPTKILSILETVFLMLNEIISNLP